MWKPSVAVERAIEIQERLHEHPFISVRIGLDMGEVSLESGGLNKKDAYGRHVDWAARTMDLAEAGHICVTRTVYTDAFSWIGKRRIAWKEHGPHRVKPGEPPLDIFEPYNANVTQPMEKLRGERVIPEARAAPAAPAAAAGPGEREVVRLARSWEGVARDGREFARNGAGIMYWFKVPLGGLSYPEGFRNFLVPALENPGIHKIRFMLDSSNEKIPEFWHHLVLPQLEEWAKSQGRDHETRGDEFAGRFDVSGDDPTTVGWVFGDLSQEYTPCFKLFVPDPDTDENTEQRAQIFLATAERTVRFKDGAIHKVRIPDAVLRVDERGNESLMQALNVVANQWDMLFL
jgi:hypothetical protein